MHWLRRVLFLVPCLVLGCADNSENTPTPQSPSLVVGCEPDLESGLRAWEGRGFNGAVAVVEASRTRCLMGLGRANRETGSKNRFDTVFSLGSVSKTFTAALILSLASDELLSLNDPVARWFESWPMDKQAITVEQLLVHTSGLGASHGEDHVPLTREQALQAIASQELWFEPGTSYEYSNSGYTLLAMIAEEATGQPFRSILRARVTTLRDGRVLGGSWDGEPAPAGERAIGYLDDGEPGHLGRDGGDHWAVDGNGGQAMSVDELATWTLNLSLGLILEEEALAAMVRPVVSLGDGAGEALGWLTLSAEVLGVDAVAASGGGGDIGHNAMLLWSPSESRIVASLSNSPELSAEELLREIGPALLRGEAMPAPPAQVALPSGVLAPLVGSYELVSGGRLRVEEDTGGVVVSAEGGSAIRVLFPIDDADSVAEHERAVSAFYAGKTGEGRAELARLERALGPLMRVEVEGTVLAQGELRTYVTLGFERSNELVWIALSELGSVQALEDQASWPKLRVIAETSDELVFVPRDLGDTPEVELEFASDGSELLVASEDGDTVALREAGP